MRQEGDGVVAALDEMIEVSRALDIPVEISHLKAIGKRNWGRAVPAMLERIARARERLRKYLLQSGNFSDYLPSILTEKEG